MSEFANIAGTRFEMKVLTEGFKDPNGPNACTSKCCKHGVYLDPTERDRILEFGDIVEKYLDDTQTRDRSRWFDNSEETDSDFKSGKCVSTEVYNDKCVFLDKFGRCVLQIAEREEGMPRFSLKPFYCVLFPIVKIDGVFHYDDLCSDESGCCSASKQSAEKMIEVCSVELQHALGPDKYGEILRDYRSGLTGTGSTSVVDQHVDLDEKDSVHAGK